MKVRMNVSIAGVNFSYHPGQEVELPDEMAEKWAAAGHCEPIGERPGEEEDTKKTKRGKK